MEFLKPILGDELYPQVEAKLKDSKVKLADLSEGAYVAKEKFDAVNEQLKAAQGTITERDGQLKTLQDMKPEEMQAEITRLQGENKAASEKATAEKAALMVKLAAESHASTIRFTSNGAKKAFVDGLIGAGLKLDESGTLLGADDYTKKAREGDPGAFEPLPAGGAGFGDKTPPNINPDSTEAAVKAALFPGK